jgi:hypothetical protein
MISPHEKCAPILARIVEGLTSLRNGFRRIDGQARTFIRLKGRTGMISKHHIGWVSSAVLGALLLAAPAAAAPIVYTVTFDATNVAAGGAGASGTGSFVYDAAAIPGTMTTFTWDFGSGTSGGVTDPALGVALPPDDSLGSFLFEIVTASAIQAIELPGSALIPPFPGAGAAYPAKFCAGIYTASLCGMNGTAPSYFFLDGTAPHRGYLTVTPATVPEPASLLLLGAAGLGFGASLRRRRRN